MGWVGWVLEDQRTIEWGWVERNLEDHRIIEWVRLERSLKITEPGNGWVGKVLHKTIKWIELEGTSFSLEPFPCVLSLLVLEDGARGKPSPVALQASIFSAGERRGKQTKPTWAGNAPNGIFAHRVLGEKGKKAEAQKW